MRTVLLLLLAATLTPADEIDDLIRDLASQDYEARESAHAALASRGASIADRLRGAAGESADPEVAGRIRLVLESIELAPDDAGGGLGCRFEVVPARARIGDEVVLRVTIRNGGDVPLVFDRRISGEIFRLGGLDPAGGRQVFQYLGPAGIGLGGGAGGSPLAPGETLEHVWTARLMERDGTIDLRIGLYGLLLDPGTATLVYEHAAAGAPVRTNRGPQLWRGTLRRQATLEVAR